MGFIKEWKSDSRKKLVYNIEIFTRFSVWSVGPTMIGSRIVGERPVIIKSFGKIK